jgi:hypothetical protein
MPKAFLVAYSSFLQWDGLAHGAAIVLANDEQDVRANPAAYLSKLVTPKFHKNLQIDTIRDITGSNRIESAQGDVFYMIVEIAGA